MLTDGRTIPTAICGRQAVRLTLNGNGLTKYKSSSEEASHYENADLLGQNGLRKFGDRGSRARWQEQRCSVMIDSNGGVTYRNVSELHDSAGVRYGVGLAE
jgi:hypothetical protein